MQKIILAAAAAALVLPASPAPAIAAAPELAASSAWAAPVVHHSHKRNRKYDSRGRYYEPRRLSRRDRVWRGRDGRYYCKRDNGTTGLVIGAAAGGLLGHEVAGRGDKTLGAIIGAVGGGLLGRSIDRGDVKCR